MIKELAWIMWWHRQLLNSRARNNSPSAYTGYEYVMSERRGKTQLSNPKPAKALEKAWGHNAMRVLGIYIITKQGIHPECDHTSIASSTGFLYD